MTVRGPFVAALYRTELRMMLRDRRTIVMSIVLPLVVMPIMLFASHAMNQRRERKLAETVYEFALAGPAAAEARAIIAGAGPGGPGDDDAPDPSGFREVEAADPARALADGALHFYLEARRAADEIAAIAETPAAPGAGASDDELARLRRLPPDVLVLTTVYRADRDDSESGATRMRRLLAGARRALRAATLDEAGFPLPIASVARVAEVNLASEGQVAGLLLGRLLTPLLLMFLLSGSAVVAIDTLAGEKERGTLETLLTTAVARAEIVAAKHLLILTVAAAITVIQVGNLLVYVGFGLIPTTTNFAAAVTPVTAVLLLVLYLPVAALVASVLLVVSGHARTYKEAQLLFFPVFLVGMLPGLAAMVPALPLRSAIVLVPVANISVAVKDTLVGRTDWLFTLLVTGILIGYFDLRGRALSPALADGLRTLDEVVHASPLDTLTTRQVLAALILVGALSVRLLQAGRPQGAAAAEIDLARVRDKLDQARRADYFAVLGLGRLCTPHEVREASERLAAEFDPRRYHGVKEDGLPAKLSEILQVVQDAREVLADDRLREEYLRGLGVSPS